MRQLAPSPFRYGVRRGLDDFARRDPVGWLQRVALANYLNRTLYLQIAIPLDLKNLATGRTLLVRGEDHDLIAESCGLERSIHIRDLCRRFQTTNVWSLGTGLLAGLTCRHVALTPRGGDLHLELRDSNASISLAVLPDVSRCYSVVFALQTDAPCDIMMILQTATNVEGAAPACTVALPNSGTYLCIAEINPEPQPATGLTLVFKGSCPSAVEFKDLIVLAYG